MVYEPVTDKFVVEEVKTDDKTTMSVYPNPEEVVYVKKPDNARVFTPESKDNVCIFQIVTIKIKCNTDFF
jgi:hypothetical protein